MRADRIVVAVRLNEYRGRGDNPHVPWTPEEIAEDARRCREAGAAIVHFHARSDDGAPSFDAARYADAIRRVRARSDVLVDVTLGQAHVRGEDARLAHVLELARDPATRPDFAPIDTGSTNVDAWDAAARAFRSDDRAYVNAVGTCMRFARRMHEAGVTPAPCAWTIPFLRQLDAMVEAGALAAPLLATLVLTEGGILGGHPGTERGLRALLDHWPARAGLAWSVCCKEGPLLPVVPMVVEAGGHLSPGLGDWHWRELGTPTNAEVVAHLVRLARATGREPASPDEVRASLAMAAPPAAAPRAPTACV